MVEQSQLNDTPCINLFEINENLINTYPSHFNMTIKILLLMK